MSTLRARATGALALAGLVVFIVGVPLALSSLGAGLPTAMPALPTPGGVWAALSAPDDGTVVLAVVVLAAWLAWAFFTVAVLIEVAWRARGLRVPRLPGFSAAQVPARTLVGAAALLFIAPMAAQAAPLAPQPVVVAAASAAALPSGVSNGGSAQSPGAAGQVYPGGEQGAGGSAAGTGGYTVRPGDSLWSIAANELGVGRRYAEIIAANPQVLDGSASVIQPGWMLRLPPAGASAGATTVVVQRGDTLSDLAQEYLGAGERYPEIAAASAPITQPGGMSLQDPDVIGVGWTLAIPAQDAPAGAAQAPQPAQPAPPPAGTPGQGELDPSAPNQSTSAPAEPGATDGKREGGASSAAPTSAPEASEPSAPPAEASPAPTASPGAAGGQQPAPPSAQLAPAQGAETGQMGELVWPARTLYGLGAVAAAGLLALLATRRRTQQRRRAPGQVLPMPTAAAARSEAELHAVADALSVAAVDHALRQLAEHCSRTGTALPRVRYARLDADTFTLYLAQPAALPEPWAGTADASTWTLHTPDAPAEEHAPNEASAPYPTLVTIGHDVDGAHLMLDLEYAGVLDLRGPPEQTSEVLAALAIELATSTWAEAAQITLVGAMPELVDALDTGRLRYLPSPARILEELTERATRERQRLAEDHGDLAHARTEPGEAERWAPEVLLIATELTDDQRDRLHALIDADPALAIAAITSNVGQGTWSLHLDPAAVGEDSAHHGVLAPLGISVQPQRLPEAAYNDLVAATTLTHPDELITPAEDHPRASTADPGPALAPIRFDAPSWAEVTSLLDADADASPASDHHATSTSTTPPAPGRDETGQQLTPVEAPITGPEAASTTSQRDGNDTQDTDEAPPGPRVLVLGDVVVEGAEGPAEQSKRGRLTELAAYIALHPGASSGAVNDAIWPERSGEINSSTRNTAVTKLRRWLSTAPGGAEHLPRHHPDAGYAFDARVGNDVAQWDQLLAGNPLTAPTQNLQRALDLVRQRPFHGHHPKRYAWAESITQRLISEIVDAVYELARRQLLAGAWRAAETTLVKGLLIEPAQERLWRMRILAAYEARDQAAVTEATERLLLITERLECDLEPETTALLTQIKGPRTDFDQLMATAK